MNLNLEKLTAQLAEIVDAEVRTNEMRLRMNEKNF